MMDNIDRQMIHQLSIDARISATDLAALIGLSVSSTAERLRRLLAGGTIAGFDIRLDPEATGRKVKAYLQIQLKPTANLAAVDQALRDANCVIDAASVTGSASYLVRVATRDTTELDALINHLRYDLDVADTTTTIVLSTLEGFPRPPGLD